jgi:hypothetical protein
MKIVVNVDYGNFEVSKAVYQELGKVWNSYGYLDNADFGIQDEENSLAYRAHPKLIAAVEKVGLKKASGAPAALAIREIPDGIEWEIDEYDGIETIHEKHRSW